MVKPHNLSSTIVTFSHVLSLQWRTLLSYWCPCNHAAKGSMQGKKGIIGKGDWCLGSSWTLLMWFLLGPPASCCVLLCVWGEGVLRCRHWRSCGEFWKSVCNMLHRMILYSVRVITSYSLSQVFHHQFLTGEGDVTVHFRIFSMYTLKFVFEKLQHTACTNLILNVLFSFSARLRFRPNISVVNVNM